MKKFIAIIVLIFVCLMGAFACGGKDDTGLQEASDYLKALYEKAGKVTNADFTRVSAIVIGDQKYTVTWDTSASSDYVNIVHNADGITVTIDVNEKSDKDYDYELKATISDGKNSTELKWNHTIPQFKVNTWEEYIAAKAENKSAGTPADPVVVEGIVTAIIGKAKGAGYNCLFLQDKDNKGAYYVYGAAEDPSAATSGIKVGMTVRCAGLKDVYSGTHEIKNGVFEIIDETIKTVTPVDYTDLFTAAKDLQDESITAAQGLLVTLKGVTIDSINKDNGYYNFKLAGKESYIRISSSVCPLTKDEQDTFKAGFEGHIGWTANATGVICVYNNNFYLTPVTVDAYEYLALPVLDDAGMVDAELGKLSIGKEVEENGKSFDAPSKGNTYKDVTISWTSSDETVAKIENEKVTFTLPAEDKQVTITATVTSGEVTKTKEFKVNVIVPIYDLLDKEGLDAAFALEAGKALDGKKVAFGTITEINSAYSSSYDNITVTIKPDVAEDDDHNIQCYRMKGGKDLKVGDRIAVTGIIKSYKKDAETPAVIEFDSGCKFVMASNETDAAILTAAFALEEGKSITGTQTVVGKIVSIDSAYSDRYGNITVTIKFDCSTDDDHNVQCFRMKGGKDLSVGDHIIVSGTIKNYKKDAETPAVIEFDSGCTYLKLTK